MVLYRFSCEQCGPVTIEHEISAKHPSTCTCCGSEQWKQVFSHSGPQPGRTDWFSGIVTGSIKDNRPEDMSKFYANEAKKHRKNSRAGKWRRYQAEKSYERGLTDRRFASERERNKNKYV